MKRALLAVGAAIAILSLTTLAAATATSRAPWSPPPLEGFQTFAPVSGAEEVAAAIADATSTPTPAATATATPTATKKPAPAATPKRPAPVAGAIGVQSSVTTVAIPKPTPVPKPVPVPVAVVPAGAPTVAQAKAYALAQIGSVQYSCVYQLWMRESGWRTYARNPSSGAYGIPQALPGSKMATAGADWATNPVTQVKWGLGYVRAAYGSACGAWAFWQSHGWY